jgi:hypothetical protein
MRLWDYVAAGTGAWLIVGACIASAPHRFRRYRKAVAQESHVNWQTHLPPVPPSPRRSDESWLDHVPADCLLDDDPILHNRFWDLVDGEKWFTS